MRQLQKGSALKRHKIRSLLATLGLLTSLTVVGAPAAFAHHDTTNQYPATWAESIQNPTAARFIFTTAWNSHSQGKDATHSAVQAWDNHLNGVSWPRDNSWTPNWGSGGEHTCGDIDSASYNNTVVFDFQNLGQSGPLAKAVGCIPSGTSHIDRGIVTVNSYFEDKFNYCGTCAPGADYDLRSAMTHEFGHITGFNGHWSESWAECPGAPPWDMDLSGRQTMCPFLMTGKTYARTLGSHDTGELDDAYLYYS